ncbi:MAG: hypothetical protein ACYST6_17835 [Planctomycetota bacterium]|jgi:hypothetical protein
MKNVFFPDLGYFCSLYGAAGIFAQSLGGVAGERYCLMGGAAILCSHGRQEQFSERGEDDYSDD